MQSPNPLNLEAGVVPVPEDQREIDAALRAGRISLRMFPYLDWRYGERGEKFTRSDSAWLAWLSRHRQTQVHKQILWLRSVLSNRGMPSLVLDSHLNVLYRQLTKSVPVKEPKYRTLSISAERLRRDRDSRISADCARELMDDFVGAVGQKPHPLLTGAAGLLVAAVADEGLGVKNAVERLQSWMADVPALRQLPKLRARLSAGERRILDSEVFAARWTKAIETTVERARRIRES
jgi:hypothetical protein